MLIEIVNPMYDVAFKYLIDDDDCAKLLLGEIIGKEIIDCELLNNEIVSQNKAKSQQSILKLDFKAKIKTSNKEHSLVIIEVQKALLDSNILRFRQYLGHQYSDKKNTYLLKGKRIPYPIIAVYFLGYNIGLANHIPILKVKPTVYNYANSEKIFTTAPFIEGLTHEMVLIQMQSVQKSGESHLERFLANFTVLNQQILAIDDQYIDKKFVTLVNRLHEATMKKEIVEQMQKENLLQEEWNNLQLEKEKAMLNVIEERRQKEEERRQKEEERRLKEDAIKNQEIAIKTMVELGISTRIIAEKLQISIEQIELIIKE